MENTQSLTNCWRMIAYHYQYHHFLWRP